MVGTSSVSLQLSGLMVWRYGPKAEKKFPDWVNWESSFYLHLTNILNQKIATTVLCLQCKEIMFLIVTFQQGCRIVWNFSHRDRHPVVEGDSAAVSHITWHMIKWCLQKDICHRSGPQQPVAVLINRLSDTAPRCGCGRWATGLWNGLHTPELMCHLIR